MEKENQNIIAGNKISFVKKVIQKEYLVVSGIFAIFILLFFSPTLAQGMLPLSSSYLRNIFPWAYYRDQFKPNEISNNILSDEYDGAIPVMQNFLTELHRGEYPSWNPYINGGLPEGLLFIYANFTIYRLSTILAGALWGLLLNMFLKMYLVGILFYLYMKYRGFSWPAAMTGSLMLMFSTSMIVNIGRTTVDSIVFAPAILYFAELFVRERKYRYYVGLVFFTGVTLISGFPSVTMYTLIMIGIYLTYRILFELHDEMFRKRIQSLLFIYSALGVGIVWTAFTLLPTYEYLQYINLGYRVGRGASRLPWKTIVNLLSPNVCGNPVQVGLSLCSTNYNNAAIYTGVLPLILIPFSLTNRKSKSTSIFFFILAVLVLMIVYGVASLNRIVGSLPLFNINPNTRMIALLPVCSAFITATGIDNLARVTHKGKYLSIPYFLLLMIGVAYSFWAIPFKTVEISEQIQYYQNQMWFTLLLLSSYSLIILIILIFRERVLRMALITIILLCFGSKVYFLSGYNGASSLDSFYPETPATTFLESEMPNYERMIVIGRHFVPSLPLYYSINSMTAHFHASVEFKQNMELISPGVYFNNRTQAIFSPASINLLSPLLDLYRVRFIVTPPAGAPIWNEVLSSQVEYNSTFKLAKLTTFSQSVTPTRDGYADRLDLRLNIPNVDSFPVQIKISDNNQLSVNFKGTMVRQPDNGWFGIDLPKIPIINGQSIQFEITPDKNYLPKGSLLYMVRSNIYKGGALFIDGQEMAGDIAFNLTQLNSKIAEKYDLVHSGDLHIYANRAVDNRIPVVNKLLYSDQDSCASILGQIDPFHEAVVDDPNVSLTGDNSGSVASISEMSVNEIVINADIRQTASMIILSDTYFPGWRATVDGAPAKIYRANCAMRGVIVAPGTHTIIMSYQPLSFKIGLGVSLFTIVGLIVAGLVLASRRRGINALQD